ncbi:MAG TPA: serine/threonine-protein kinase [Pyrinomonadaceae bacterium]|nr:serine/threonine-protein kinase [Pyrinomonadaceae bacterium]
MLGARTARPQRVRNKFFFIPFHKHKFSRFAINADGRPRSQRRSIGNRQSTIGNVLMTPERWQQVEEVLQAALDRGPAERAVFLEQVCAGDAELQSEASSLVSAYDAAADFIEEPAIAQDARVILGDHSINHIGQEIGPYKIIDHLGSGGMGEVYLAHDARLDRLVALKVLPAYFVSDDTRLRRFQREARAASALNHPNILTIHEVGELDGVHFIATEFIDGQTIRELIARDELSLKDVLDIVAQVASAISAAHAAGIVHRDIKPENIMRRGDGIVKVLDFGIAKLLEQTPADLPAITRQQTETGIVLGTVGYMSPEQARGLPVDERTDIWSLGVVLYEMLAYRAPFAGATRMDTMVAILERELAPLELTDDPKLQRLWTIVNKTLRKETAERYQTAAELLADLTAARRELDTFDRSKERVVLGLIRESIPKAGVVNSSEVSATLAREQAISTAFPPGKSNGYHRYGLLALGLVALIVLGGVFLYQRFSPQRKIVVTTPAASAIANKLYTQMSEAEQLQFVDEQEQRISAMMGDRPVKLNEEALRAIKNHVDRYAAREGTTSNKPGGESLNVVYGRAVPFVPLIARVFAARKIPSIVGIYLPMIESEYKPCFVNQIGATGLFQFLPDTARNYGVAREDMCDVEKMTPAAAHYIADRMAELGEDSGTMTLVILSYNTGPTWVVDTLRQLRETENYQRNFWTIYANRDKLDNDFRNQAGYVPSFFAAAIIGENPRNFGLSIPPLSTLASDARR